MPTVVFQPDSTALPPIKLDGKIYVIVAGTYQRLKNEMIITARYTDSGGIDIQKVNTGKHRWRMTLLVPNTSSNIEVSDAPFSSSDMGTMADFRATADKVAATDELSFFDIDSNWIFVGDEPYTVFVESVDFTPPHQDGLNCWRVSILLWGFDFISAAALGGLTLDGWTVFMVRG